MNAPRSTIFTQLNSAKHHLYVNVRWYQITSYGEAPREAPRGNIAEAVLRRERS
jgi:hypothetical protein